MASTRVVRQTGHKYIRRSNSNEEYKKHTPCQKQTIQSTTFTCYTQIVWIARDAQSELDLCQSRFTIAIVV